MLSRYRFYAIPILLVLFAVLSLNLVTAQEPTTLDVYVDSNTNISDWWANTLIPMFEEAHPEYRVNLVNTGGDGGKNGPIADRALAALATGDDPLVDMFESIDVSATVGSIDAGLWIELDETNVPNAKNILPAAWDAKAPPGHWNMPYRGSQVLLVYNSDKIAEEDLPKTWDDLVSWIKANPGQFVYLRPDKGGAGRNFVVRAIMQANGSDPKMFTADNFTADLAKERFAGGWDILNDLAPSLYDGGAYPAGTTPAMQLLTNEEISMMPIWSDQALQAMNQEVLPSNYKLFQLQDLAFVGGYAPLAIPTNAAHKEGALVLADFLLTPEVQSSVISDIGGFPAVNWDQLPADMQAQFSNVITSNVPTYPSGDWNNTMIDEWYTNVAAGSGVMKDPTPTPSS